MSGRAAALTARRGAGWCVALLGVAIPVSTAFDSILTGILLLAWLFAFPWHWRETLRCYRTVPALWIALLLFALLLLSATWSSAPLKAGWSAASKYLDLAVIPAFAWAATLREETRKYALAGAIGAVILSLAVSYGSALALWDRVPFTHSQPSYPTGFKLSVTHNIFAGLAAFVLLLLARDWRGRSPGRALAAVALALLCMHNLLFVVIGRTGYIVLAALLVYFAVVVSRDRRSALLAALLISTLFASAYALSTAFSARVQDIASDLVSWKPGASDETSVGQRVGYYRTTLTIVAEHPWTGVGAGGFSAAYADKVRGTSAPATTNPHNDYLMIAAQAGIPALALLVALYGALWKEAARLRTRLETHALRGIVLAMALGGLFNSLLLDHAEGLLFAWAVGLLLAGRLRPWT